MGIAASHPGPAILENLHRTDVRITPEFRELSRPGNDHASSFGHAHSAHREIVPWREADHPAPPRFAAGNQKSPFLNFPSGRIWLQRRKIVVKHKRLRVGGVSHSSCSSIAGTKVAARIVSCRRFR